MVEGSDKFPHIQLRLTDEGIYDSKASGRKAHPQTLANKNNRGSHGRKLKGLVLSMIYDWKQLQEEREEESKPRIEARRIILKIDPTSFDPEDIKSYGIELISELEDGYIIGASVDGIIPSAAHLPDSFSCRIQISGKGLKDLVVNFPYLFDVSEPDQFAEFIQRADLSDGDSPSFQLQPPNSNAPKICVIDSGIQERHPLLKAAIDLQNSKSWVPGDKMTADYVKNGGHGTRVASAILYPRTIPKSGNQQAICWIQNARVLDDQCQLNKYLFPPNLLGEIVELYNGQIGTRIFNHSIAATVPCRTTYMSAWASAIDYLTWQKDILLIAAAGNLQSTKTVVTRLSIVDHLKENRGYPEYLLEDSCRIANPAQSFQALTVGSVAMNYYHTPDSSSMAQKDMPSAFSCTGLGIWETIKPEVVEYGGDLVKDKSIPPNFTSPQQVCPELVRSTLNGGPPIASEEIGTSFAAPKVTHIAACLTSELPNESCLLYRTLIVQSARWPEWTRADNIDKLHVLRYIGYGIPDIDRALGNASHRITLITRGDQEIKAKQVHIYQVKIPEVLRSLGEDLDILVEVTLSYKAKPRRTRRNKRKYLSTWLDWDSSKKGEDPKRFLEGVLKAYNAPEESDKGEGTFRWTLGKQKNYGVIKDVSRSAGSIQKDWTVVKSFELTEAFCIAVVGHEGWNNDPDATAPYCLVVSFEAIKANVPIYATLAKAQVEMEIKARIQVQ